MRRILAIGGVLAATLSIAGCGGDDKDKTAKTEQKQASITASEMITRAVDAAEKQTSAKLKMTLSADIKSDDPSVQAFLSKPISLTLDGKSSDKAIDLVGNLALNGEDYPFGVRADGTKSFIKLADVWYDGGSGLDTSASVNTPSETAELREAVTKYADRLIKGSVVEGPKTDGVDTWQLKGALNADEIIKIAEEDGETFTEDEKAGIRALAPLLSIEIITGREDNLIRKLSINIDLTPQQVATLDTLSTQSGGERVSDSVKEAHLKFEFLLSDWGTSVDIQAPDDVRSEDELGGALMGLLMSAGAGSTGDPSITPVMP